MADLNSLQLMDQAIERVTQGIDLTKQEMQQIIAAMLRGETSAEKMGTLLLALRAKGEAVAEIAGAALAMRHCMLPIRACSATILDTCGTGGDGTKTFNISTAAAIVAAAAGATVAKHGNRKITSATGSADVLTELGIEVEAPRETVERCLDDIGICFCFAPKLHPAMKEVAAVRRSLGVPTLFNLLGPLCNPAGATHQVLGVGNAILQEKLAAAVQLLPMQRTVVVRGLDGVDEVSLEGETEVIDVTNQSLVHFRWHPSMFGLEPAGREQMLVDTPAQSAEVIRSILQGKTGPCRDVVVLNAAAGLHVAGLEPDLKKATQRAASAIDSGRARQLLTDLAKLSRRV